MRQWYLAIVLGLVLASNTGCILPAYSGDPVQRTRELIHTSEDLRAFNEEWQRFWFLDQPSHMTPYHNHGGVL